MLTGGASARMGADKALLVLDGVPMALRAAAALRDAGAVSVTAIGGDVAGLRRAGLDARLDDHPGQGPLGGILTALRIAAEPVLVLLPCDVVHPDPAAIGAAVRALVATPGALAAVPRRDGRLEPLHGAYARGAHAPLGTAFAAGERAVHRALRSVLFAEVPDVDPRALVDADTPGDLQRRGVRTPTASLLSMDVSELPVPEIGVDELARRRDAGIVLIDVRQPDEYDEFHVPGAILIPLADVPQRLVDVPDAGTVHVICRSGGRSRTAVAFLRARGYEAVNVAGGSLAWQESGRPVATGSHPA